MSEPFDIPTSPFVYLSQFHYDFFVHTDSAVNQADLKFMDQVEVELTNRIAATPPVRNPQEYSEAYWIERSRASRACMRHGPTDTIPERVSDTRREWLDPNAFWDAFSD